MEKSLDLEMVDNLDLQKVYQKYQQLELQMLPLMMVQLKKDKRRVPLWVYVKE